MDRHTIVNPDLASVVVNQCKIFDPVEKLTFWNDLNMISHHLYLPGKYTTDT